MGCRIRCVEEPMQKRGMGWIDADLQRLQPVAGDMALEGEDMAVGGDKAVEIGESRRFARHVERPEIGEQDAAAQHDGIILLPDRSEEHTSELQSLMRLSYAVFCLKKKNNTQ